MEDYEGLRKHFGRYLLAFFPDATGALRTQADLQEWLETPNTGAGILRVPPVSRIFSTPVQVDAPPSPPVSVSTRSRQSRAVKPKSHVSCASSAALPPQTGCWCSDLCSNIIGALPDEMTRHEPTTTARTSKLPPPPSPLMIDCSECHRSFHWFCVRNLAPSQCSDATWTCSQCTASKAAPQPHGVKLDDTAAVVADLPDIDVAKCDQLNTAWAQHCRHCQTRPEPALPVKLKASDTWQMCFTLSVDMLCEWAIKGMQKSPSMTFSCTSCYMPTTALQQADSEVADSYDPRTWLSMMDDARGTASSRGKKQVVRSQLDKPLVFWEPAQSVPSPLHVLIGLGNNLLERVQVTDNVFANHSSSHRT